MTRNPVNIQFQVKVNFKFGTPNKFLDFSAS